MGIEVIVKMVLVAAATSALTCGFFVFALKTRKYAATVAVTLGFIAGYWVAEGDLSLLPKISEGAKGSFPHVAILAATAALLAERFSSPRWLWWLAAASASIASSFLLYRAPMKFAWTGSESMVWLGLSSVGMFGTMLLFRSSAAATGPRVSAFNLGLIAALGAPVILFSDVLSGAQLSGAVAVAVGVVFLFAALGKKGLRGSGAAVVGAVLWALWMMSFLLAEMPWASLLLLCLAMPLASLALLLGGGRLGARSLVALQVVAVLLSVGGALGIGAERYFRPAADSPTGDLGEGEYNPNYGY